MEPIRRIHVFGNEVKGPICCECKKPLCANDAISAPFCKRCYGLAQMKQAIQNLKGDKKDD